SEPTWEIAIRRSFLAEVRAKKVVTKHVSWHAARVTLVCCCAGRRSRGLHARSETVVRLDHQHLLRGRMTPASQPAACRRHPPRSRAARRRARPPPALEEAADICPGCLTLQTFVCDAGLGRWFRVLQRRDGVIVFPKNNHAGGNRAGRYSSSAVSSRD